MPLWPVSAVSKMALSYLHQGSVAPQLLPAGIAIPQPTSQPEAGLLRMWHRQRQEHRHECKSQLHSVVTYFIPLSLSVPICEVGLLPTPTAEGCFKSGMSCRIHVACAELGAQ